MDMIIISNRHISIKNAVASVFSEAAHGLCAFHMKNNVSSTYRNPDVTTLFVKASRVYRTDEFKELMDELKIMKSKAYEKLIDDDVRKWSRAYCPVRRYDLMTTNIVESMNSALRHARKLSITPLMESIRNMLQKWFHIKRISTERTATPLTGRVLSILQKNWADSEFYTAEAMDKYVYHVRGGTKDRLVNLTDKSCTCRRFNLDLIPCSHACAAIRYVYIWLLYVNNL